MFYSNYQFPPVSAYNCERIKTIALLKVFGDMLKYIQLFNQECEGWSGSQRGDLYDMVLIKEDLWLEYILVELIRNIACFVFWSCENKRHSLPYTQLYSKQQNILIAVAKLLFKMKSTQVLALSTYYGVCLQNNVLYFTYIATCIVSTGIYPCVQYLH